LGHVPYSRFAGPPLGFGHSRAEPALECGGLTPPFSLNMLGLQIRERS